MDLWTLGYSESHSGSHSRGDDGSEHNKKIQIKSCGFRIRCWKVIGYIWIIASALVLLWPWILNLTSTMDQDQDPSLTISNPKKVSILFNKNVSVQSWQIVVWHNQFYIFQTISPLRLYITLKEDCHIYRLIQSPRKYHQDTYTKPLIQFFPLPNTLSCVSVHKPVFWKIK